MIWRPPSPHCRHKHQNQALIHLQLRIFSFENMQQRTRKLEIGCNGIDSHTSSGHWEHLSLAHLPIISHSPPLNYPKARVGHCRLLNGYSFSSLFSIWASDGVLNTGLYPIHCTGYWSKSCHIPRFTHAFPLHPIILRLLQFRRVKYSMIWDWEWRGTEVLGFWVCEWWIKSLECRGKVANIAKVRRGTWEMKEILSMSLSLYQNTAA